MMIAATAERKKLPPRHILRETDMAGPQNPGALDLQLTDVDLVLETGVHDLEIEDPDLETDGPDLEVIVDQDLVPEREEIVDDGAEAETAGEETTEETFPPPNPVFFRYRQWLPGTHPRSLPLPQFHPSPPITTPTQWALLNTPNKSAKRNFCGVIKGARIPVAAEMGQIRPLKYPVSCPIPPPLTPLLWWASTDLTPQGGNSTLAWGRISSVRRGDRRASCPPKRRGIKRSNPAWRTCGPPPPSPMTRMAKWPRNSRD